mgnify:CR=1 FL=1
MNIMVSNKRKNAVLILENDCNTIEETIYLSSIPGFINNINEIRENENWKIAKKYNSDEEW